MTAAQISAWAAISTVVTAPAPPPARHRPAGLAEGVAAEEGQLKRALREQSGLLCRRGEGGLAHRSSPPASRTTRATSTARSSDSSASHSSTSHAVHHRWSGARG